MTSKNVQSAKNAPGSARHRRLGKAEAEAEAEVEVEVKAEVEVEVKAEVEVEIEVEVEVEGYSFIITSDNYKRVFLHRTR